MTIETIADRVREALLDSESDDAHSLFLEMQAFATEYLTGKARVDEHDSMLAAVYNQHAEELASLQAEKENLAAALGHKVQIAEDRLSLAETKAEIYSGMLDRLLPRTNIVHRLGEEATSPASAKAPITPRKPK